MHFSMLCFVFQEQIFNTESKSCNNITRNNITILETKLPITGMQLRFLKMADFAEQYWTDIEKKVILS